MTLAHADLRQLLKIEGWFTQQEATPVMRLASDVCPPATIVEIGSYAGRSTAFIASAAAKGRGAHVTSIDPWLADAIPGGTTEEDAKAAEEVLGSYLNTMTGLGLNVSTLRARGEDVAAMWVWPVGLLFLDASHLYPDTLAQLRAWQPHMPIGAHVALHDHHPDNPGVMQAVAEVMGDGFEDGRQVGTLKVLRRA